MSRLPPDDELQIRTARRILSRCVSNWQPCEFCMEILHRVLADLVLLEKWQDGHVEGKIRGEHPPRKEAT